MDSTTLMGPLTALAALFALLFLLDFAFGVEPIVYAAFVPILLWGVIALARGRG